MVVSSIEKAAESAGIAAFISNSEERIENQLNKLTRHEDLPIMLVSWDLESSVSFDENGFLTPPNTNVIALLMGKAEYNTAESRKEKIEEIEKLLHVFLRGLYADLVHFNHGSASSPLTNVGYTHNPIYGPGKHSGLLVRWTMISEANNCS